MSLISVCTVASGMLPTCAASSASRQVATACLSSTFDCRAALEGLRWQSGRTHTHTRAPDLFEVAGEVGEGLGLDEGTQVELVVGSRQRRDGRQRGDFRLLRAPKIKSSTAQAPSSLSCLVFQSLAVNGQDFALLGAKRVAKIGELFHTAQTPTAAGQERHTRAAEEAMAATLTGSSASWTRRSWKTEENRRVTLPCASAPRVVKRPIGTIRVPSLGAAGEMRFARAPATRSAQDWALGCESCTRVHGVQGHDRCSGTIDLPPSEGWSPCPQWRRQTEP
jgi:hypothetical protein